METEGTIASPTANAPPAANELPSVAQNTVLEAKQNADKLYDAIKASIGTQSISVASVIIMITTAMVEVEKITSLTGPQKKELVIHVIGRLIDEIPSNQEDKAAIKSAFVLFAPSIIDTIVAASRGKYNLNLASRTKKGCCIIC